MSSRDWGWLAPTGAALAFVAVLVVFGREIGGFRADVERWALRDLRTQVRLAAATLDEPLHTQNFRRIGEIAQALKADHGLLLTVYSPQGGVFYRVPARDASDMHASARAGEYRIELAFPREMVLLPFRRARFGFGLATLAGMLGMFVVFFALYRQRVKLRELARLERFRREFIADVSHEIKTPLTGILGAVDMLKDGETAKAATPAMRQTLIGMIERESRRLNALVQQILDLARLERAETALNRSETEVGPLVREVVGACAPAAASKGVAIALSADGVEACRITCDVQLVSQALSNLIVNAVRHSGAKSVTVGATATGQEVCFCVEDHGVGIPPEHAQRIFERFHRVDPSRAANSGGAGLGLAIVRRIARLHGGDVRLEPAVPQGARFVLTLPR